MSRQILTLLAALLLAFLICCEQPTLPKPTGSLILSLTFPEESLPGIIKAGNVATISSVPIDSIQCTITHDGQIQFDQPLDTIIVGADTLFRAEITLEARSGYHIQLEGYITHNLCYSYENDFDIAANRTDTLGVIWTKEYPHPPINLSAFTDSVLQISLSWSDESENEDKFFIERKSSFAGSFVIYDSVEKNEQNYLDSELEENLTYYYRVYARNAAGDSGYSNVANATTNLNPPTAPKELEATATSADTIRLTWRDSSNNESGFTIWRQKKSAGWESLTSVGQSPEAGSLIQYDDGSLTEYTTYYYFVLAYNNFDTSEHSDTDTVTTLLAAPSSLTATFDSASAEIKLTWTNHSDSTDSVHIERKSGSSGVFIRIQDVGDYSYEDMDIEDNIEYYYRVQAFLGTDVSNYSNPDSATAGVSILAAPDNLTGLLLPPNVIYLHWNDNSSNELGFVIKRSPPGSIIDSVDADSNWYFDASNELCDNSTYIYQVAAYNTLYTSQNSDPDTVDIPLAAPTNLQATASSIYAGTIDLSWNDNSSSEDSFKIERRTETSAYGVIASVGASINNYQDTEHSLLEDSVYWYQVRAYTSADTSDPSDPDSATARSFVEWDTTLTTLGIGEGYSVVETNDGGYVVVATMGSESSPSIKMLKISNDGSSIEYLYDKTDAATYSCQKNTDGYFIIAGINTTQQRALLIKLNALGTVSFDSTYDYETYDTEFRCAQKTSDGGYICVGTAITDVDTNVYVVKAEANGNTVWTKLYGDSSDADSGYGVVEADDGEYVIVGSTASYGSGGSDVWLLKVDTVGAIIDSFTYGGSNDDAGNSIIKIVGGYIIVGYTTFSGDKDVLLIKTDFNGGEMWNRNFGENGNDVGYSVQKTDDNGYIIAGYCEPSGSNNIILLIKTDESGNSSWSYHFAVSASDNDCGRSVLQTSDGGYILTGSKNGQVYVAKTMPNPGPFGRAGSGPLDPSNPWGYDNRNNPWGR